MISVWKCATCFHANKTDDDAPCYWCGGTERKAIFPVTVPNQLQGTPTYDDLNHEIAIGEANRETDVPFEEQLRDLLARFRVEKK